METDTTGAVVLTGGSAVRLDGVDKASIELGGLTLLEHTLDALADVAEIVVVGDHVPTSRPVTFTREDPTGGGPAAGLLTGLRAFARPPARVVVLAVDMPLVTGATIQRLREAFGDDGAALVDDAGRLQYLCAIYATAALERARPAYEKEYGLSMRRLVGALRIVQVPSYSAETHDVDTWADLRDLRETFGD